MITSECVVCGKEIVRGGSKPGKTCSRECAAELRRQWKPVSKEWLEERYLREGLGTVQIARLVGRHPKRVYEWLVNLGIPLREKWQGNAPRAKPYHDAAWLREQYEKKGRTLADIGRECGATPLTVLKYLRKYGIPSRTSYESLKLTGKARDVRGPKNWMFGRKGALAPSWRGGCTPERQAFYDTPEWADAVKAVWRRDKATCQRCGKKKENPEEEFCIHHIVSFAVKELRVVLSNLLLFCKPCHKWVHSRKNKRKEFIKEHDKGHRPTPG